MISLHIYSYLHQTSLLFTAQPGGDFFAGNLATGNQGEVLQPMNKQPVNTVHAPIQPSKGDLDTSLGKVAMSIGEWIRYFLFEYSVLWLTKCTSTHLVVLFLGPAPEIFF